MTAGKCHRQTTDGCQLVDSHVEISDTLSLPLLCSSHHSHWAFFFFLLFLPLFCHCEGKSSVLTTCGLFGLGSLSRKLMRCRDISGFVKRKYSLVLIMLSALTYPSARGKEITRVHQRNTHSKVHIKLIRHNQKTASLTSMCVCTHVRGV